MGNLCSVNWKNKEASAYGAFLVNLLGNPAIYVKKEGGMLIWNEKQLSQATLFGLPICFRRVVVLDTDITHDSPAKHTDFLSIYFSMPSPMPPCPLMMFVDIFNYDPVKQCMILRCNCLGKIIVAASIIMDYMVNMKDTRMIGEEYRTGIKMILDPKSKTGVNMDLVKKAYETLLINTKKYLEMMKALTPDVIAAIRAAASSADGPPGMDIQMDSSTQTESETQIETPPPSPSAPPIPAAAEGWVDEPWYALSRQGDPYASHYAHDVESVRADDAGFYDNLDSYEHKRGVSVFAQAPTGKPSIENLINFPRYSNNGRYESYTPKQIFRQKAEHLIEFPKVERFNNRDIFRKGGREHLVQMSPSCKGACAQRVKKQMGSERFSSIYPSNDSPEDVRRQLGMERLTNMYPGCQSEACLKKGIRKELGIERLDVVNNATNDKYAVYSPEIQALYTPVKGVLPPKNLEYMTQKKLVNAIFRPEYMTNSRDAKMKARINAISTPEYYVVGKKKA
jgi:hypothetical protein